MSSIIDILKGNPNFTILVEALERTCLDHTLLSGCFTIFAPTNDAFMAFFVNSLDDINDATLNLILLYTISPDKIPLPESGSINVTTFLQQGVLLDVNDLTIGNAAIVAPFDTMADNGIIQTIDAVIFDNDLTLPDPLPNLPELLPTCSDITDTSIKINWNSSIYYKYCLLDNDIEIASDLRGNDDTDCFEYTSLTPDTSYTFTLKVKDINGNELDPVVETEFVCATLEFIKCQNLSEDKIRQTIKYWDSVMMGLC